MGARNRPKPYDPTWVVALARQQCPDKPWLADSLAQCTTSFKRTRGKHKKLIYVNFFDSATVESMRATSTGPVVANSVSLQHPLFGHLILDILADNRVLGIEFYDRLFSSGKPKPPPESPPGLDGKISD